MSAIQQRTVSPAPRSPSATRHMFGMWMVAFTVVTIFAFSNVPSPLYVLYAHRDHFSSFMITVIYGAYAIGVVGCVLFVSHLSDVHGRRPHLVTAVLIAVVACLVLLFWRALPGLLIARVLTGAAAGLTASTATAHINELHDHARPGAGRALPNVVAATAALAGIGLGAVMAGVLGQEVAHPLTIPYLVILLMLLVSLIGLVVTPETRERPTPLPPYRRQRISVPNHARPRYFAACLGTFLNYAVTAVLIGLIGTFLVSLLHVRSLIWAGGSIGLLYAVGIIVLKLTAEWPARRLLASGAVVHVAGLALVVVDAWLGHPKLYLLLIGAGMIGAGVAVLFKGTLDRVVDLAPAETLGEALAGYYCASYVGLSLPAIAVGVGLQYLSPRVTLLIFASIVSLGLILAARTLVNVDAPDRTEPE